MPHDQRKKSSVDVDFFTEYGEGSRYKIEEVIGKGSYGVVCSAYDTHTGEKVAIKKINDIFEHVSDATRILREIKLLRLLRHPDIVEIKHILLPPSRREFKDIYVVFELMESDLHQVIKANDDLTAEHYQFFLYQLLRGLKYIHTANVFHRDLKPKNILANADCKLKICDFGLARVAFNDTPTAIFWTDYVATRWYRAPELCGSFFSKYTPAIDIWSIGCIFAELLTGKPLFPGKNVVHQLDLMTDFLGTPSPEAIARVRNEKARRYLSSMRKKKPVPFSQKFPNVDPLALRVLEKMLAFEPKDRPTAEEALADPYFKGLAKVEREPSAQPVTKMEFEFERRRITKEDVRELIYREILEYHPKMLKEHLDGEEPTGFMYPSAVDHFKKQFAYLEEHYGEGGTVTPPERQHASSLPRPCVLYSDNPRQNMAVVADDLSKCSIKEVDKPAIDKTGAIPMTRPPLQQAPQNIRGVMTDRSVAPRLCSLLFCLHTISYFFLFSSLLFFFFLIFLRSFPTTPFPNTQSSSTFQNFLRFSMATAPAQPPVKSQPLHNFALPFLKWGASGKNHTNAAHHHRCRRPSSLSSDHASEPDSDPDSRPHRVGSRTTRNRFALPTCSLKPLPPPPEPPQPPSCNDETDDEAAKRDIEDAEEAVQKPWNLRPRKPALPKSALEIGTGPSRNHANNGVGEFHDGVSHHGENPAPKSLRLRGFADTQCAEKKEKRKFWIALSREEIEEDIFVMTGSRPARRPRKRPKNVQKQMDSVFPGLWLVGITADAYRVPDTPTKR